VHAMIHLPLYYMLKSRISLCAQAHVGLINEEESSCFYSRGLDIAAELMHRSARALITFALISGGALSDGDYSTDYGEHVLRFEYINIPMITVVPKSLISRDRMNFQLLIISHNCISFVYLNLVFIRFAYDVISRATT
jgi:hypothetical protein